MTDNITNSFFSNCCGKIWEVLRVENNRWVLSGHLTMYSLQELFKGRDQAILKNSLNKWILVSKMSYINWNIFYCKWQNSKRNWFKQRRNFIAPITEKKKTLGIYEASVIAESKTSDNDSVTVSVHLWTWNFSAFVLRQSLSTRWGASSSQLTPSNFNNSMGKDLHFPNNSNKALELSSPF